MEKEITKQGTAIKAANPDDATPEAREARAKNAIARQSPEVNKPEPGPVHKFTLTYGEHTETIGVAHRHKGQAELEARALFNDKLPKKVRRPGPREVSVVAL
jgi:hypothetical protein